MTLLIYSSHTYKCGQRTGFCHHYLHHPHPPVFSHSSPPLLLYFFLPPLFSSSLFKLFGPAASFVVVLLAVKSPINGGTMAACGADPLYSNAAGAVQGPDTSVQLPASNKHSFNSLSSPHALMNIGYYSLFEKGLWAATKHTLHVPPKHLMNEWMYLAGWNEHVQ